MKKFYLLLEKIRDILAVLLRGYDPSIVYRTTMYSLVYAALVKNQCSCRLLKSLEGKMPVSLVAFARGKLYYLFLELLSQLDLLLNSKRAVIVEGEANLQVIIDWLKYEAGKVDYVMIYDCMSLVEFLVVSAYLRFKGIRTVFLSKVFLNPIGLTKFITQQLYSTHYDRTLREVACLIANSLESVSYYKSSYLDKRVHECGHLGVEEFVEVVDISRIIEEVLAQAIRGDLLVGTDHGYDLVVVKSDDYVYITHGFKINNTYKAVSLIPLSRFAIFMKTYR